MIQMFAHNMMSSMLVFQATRQSLNLTATQNQMRDGVTSKTNSVTRQKVSTETMRNIHSSLRTLGYIYIYTPQVVYNSTEASI